MADLNTENIVDIEPYSFTNYLVNSFLSIFGWMFFAFVLSIFISGNASNQVTILLFYIGVVFVLLALNLIAGFRRPYIYIYSMVIDNDIVTIKYLRLFKRQLMTVNINDLEVRLEKQGQKNFALIIVGLIGEHTFHIKQTEVHQWKKKLLSTTFEKLSDIITPRTIH